MKRTIGTTIVRLSVLSFGIFGANIGDGGIVKADHGRLPISKQDSHADLPAPKFEDHGKHI
ncbi:hypothetical protein FC699_29640 [Bacillus wiedmannii]|uniref:Uncharacterized protein n=1 Tax=Bacillus wiedmannii TaxID=1890302 RepID=A0A4U2MWF1_9BACI|nr:hypothetical protein [Bacillus wiedmannii]TKH15972.1 hypothetical protein FC694_13960 [Bacillus wiedmannii]TKI87031.1 hypothetical protein FC699_29640 [Bacillus wiedmannii]